MAKKFTKQGLEKFKKELDFLKNVKQREIAKQLKYAAGFGDFSENAAYDQAKEARAFVRGRIIELEKILVNAQVIDISSNDKAEIGSTITISSDEGKEIVQIVESEEADPLNKKISFQSPLGKALYQKKAGDKAIIETSAGKTTYQILKIA